MGTSQKWAVVAVDLDGTLIHGTTACLHLGAWIGHLAVVEDLERRFAAGEIANADVADGDAPYYEGRSIAEVAHAMAGARASMTSAKVWNNSRLVESMRCCAP